MDGLLAPYAGVIKTIKIIFSFIWGEFSQWHDLASLTDTIPSIWWMMFVTLLIWVYLMSGFVAATIAESRGRAPMGHFFLGLLLPGLYPAMINNSMENIVEEEKKNEVIEEKEKDHEKSIELTSRFMEKAGMDYTPTDLKLDEDGKEIEEEKPQEEDNYPFNRLYFSGIATRPDGNPAGPFKVTLNDGRVVNADLILEILDDVVIFQINGNTGKPRKVRLFYKLISGCDVQSA